VRHLVAPISSIARPVADRRPGLADFTDRLHAPLRFQANLRLKLGGVRLSLLCTTA
jgi:hypothetical protein